MPRKLITDSALYAGVPYSYVAIAPAGTTVFTAGACPLDANGDVVGLGDLARQTRQALDRTYSSPSMRLAAVRTTSSRRPSTSRPPTMPTSRWRGGR